MNFIERLFVEPMQRFYENVIQYLPNVMSFILILIAGWVLGRVLRSISMQIFKFLHVDKVSERTGLHEIMQKGGIREHMSVILARLVGWATVFVFLIIALNVLAVPEVDTLLRSFFLYLPNLLVAIIILFVGYLLANFLSRAALIAAVNSDIQMSGAIGKFVKFGILVLAVTMALEQLGIGRETIIVAFTVIFGGAVFAISLAVGLGAKDIARNFLEGLMAGKKAPKKEEDDISHL
jgi:small-conductance mechanosensitive channel